MDKHPQQLLKQGLLPTEVAAGKNNDTGVIDQTIDVWEPLYEHRFCPWYKARLAAGSDNVDIKHIQDMGK